MQALSNPFADERCISTLAETLKTSRAEVNTAIAAYLPRDTVEVGMIEQILLLRHNLHQATRAAGDPTLSALQADRLRRTVCTIDRQLERVSIRLEKRQFQTRGLLPQQYWRDTPIQAVGPFDDAEVPEQAAAQPEPAQPVAWPAPLPILPATVDLPEPMARHHPDDPSSTGDALHQLARMRIDQDLDPAQLWAMAERNAERSRARHGDPGRHQA